MIEGRIGGRLRDGAGDRRKNRERNKGRGGIERYM